MAYLLLFLLFLMFFIVLYINRWDIISPWSISVSMFCLSTLVAALNIKNWGVDVTIKCIFVIIGALIAFGIGDLTVNRFFKKYPQRSSERLTVDNLEINIPVKITLVICTLMLIGMAIVFRRAYNISLEGGNPGGLKDILMYIRRVTVKPGNHMGRFCNHILILSQAISFVYLWALITNVANKRFIKYQVIYIIPSIIYIIMSISGAGRNFLIQLFALVLIISILLFNKSKQWTKKKCIKVIMAGVSVIAIYAVLFRVLGRLKGGGGDFIEVFSAYLGSSIVDLSEFLERQREETSFIGGETLYGVFAIVRKFGVNIPEEVRHLEQGVVTNVYTSLRRYINDFGYMGMLIIQVYIGAFYAAVYNIVRNRQGVSVIIYGYLMYPLVMQAIDDILITNYISSTSVYFIFYLLVVYYVLIVKSKGWKLYENIHKNSGNSDSSCF